jgi:hypothetical protein
VGVSDGSIRPAVKPPAAFSQRTEAEYSALLRKAGFNLVRVVPTASAVSVVEAVLA